MGMFMEENDIYVGSMLDELNIRFAPSTAEDTAGGGIQELAPLDKEFGIFRQGRSFESSVATLNLGAWNKAARKGWHDYLKTLDLYDSNQGILDGDAAIVQALTRNFASSSPLPVYFTAHDMREPGQNIVIVTESARPLFYMDADYLVVSFPMQPASAANPAKPARSRKA